MGKMQLMTEQVKNSREVIEGQQNDQTVKERKRKP